MRGLLATLLLLALPAGAHAASARVEGDVLVYEAAPGEANDVVVAYLSSASLSGGAAEYRIAEVEQMVRSQEPPVTPLAGCRAHTTDPTHIVACPAADVAAVRVALGDGRDRARTLGDYRGAPGTESCEQDLLYSADDIPHPLTFDGGSGDDELFEGPYMIIQPRGVGCSLPRSPHAVVRSYGGPGDDLIMNAAYASGGPGADSLEAPNLARTVQVGGPGGDTLLGGRGTDRLDGGAGDDIVDGGPGADMLVCGSGSDLAEGGSAGDSLLGGVGADELNGNDGGDRIDGGGGSDVLEGEAGADALAARDGQRDGVSGGSGGDKAKVDRRDRVAGVEQL